MRSLMRTSVRLLLVAGFVELPLTFALGHEGHHAECNETAINALKADIQAMGEGEARTIAAKELEAAQQMMAKNDMEGCKGHIHSGKLSNYGTVNDPLLGQRPGGVICKHPPELSAKRLMRLALKLPADWAEQRKLLGFQEA